MKTVSGIDLSDLGLDELETLKSDTEKAIKTLKARRRAEALAAAEAAAREHGFSLSELSGAKIGRAKAAHPPKYQHPENPEVTWSGRGRRPNWFIEALNGGTAPEEMEIG